MRQYLKQRDKPLATANDLTPSQELDAKKIKDELSVLTTFEEKKAYLFSLKADLLEKNVLNQIDPSIKFIDIELQRIENL